MTLQGDLDLVDMLQGIAGRQLGHGVAVAARDPRQDQPGLMPGEQAAVVRAVETRRREFACGRAAARRALAQIGIYGQPVPAGPDRAPVWPSGVVGCITHTGTMCLAAVARADGVLSIGIDLEPATPLESALMETVLTPGEATWIAARPGHRQGILAKTVFSAKECTFKCQYPLTGAMFGFDALAVELDETRKQFRAVRVPTPVGCAPENAMTGRYTTIMGHILTTMVLRR